eukprot:scaffold37532_cov33-Tisochrysis_lutea.AAC.4
MPAATQGNKSACIVSRLHRDLLRVVTTTSRSNGRMTTTDLIHSGVMDPTWVEEWISHGAIT